MKKSLLALAVLGAFAGSAMAQSSVTLYGVADVNISSAKGGTSRLTSMGSGGLQGSRVGFRGTEDLGGGLKANFVLENGYNIDTGTFAQIGTNTNTGPAAGTRLFGRAAWVGLSGGFGEVRLGRQLTAIGALTDELGPLSTKGADLYAVAGSSGNALYRTDNAIQYLSPNIAGFTVNAQYSLQVEGAEQAKPNEKSGEHWNLAAQFKTGPIHLGLGYIEVADRLLATPGDQKLKGLLGFAGVTFGGFTVRASYDKTDIGAAKDKVLYGLSLQAPLGPVDLGVGVAKAKDVTGAAGVSDDATLANVQAVYNMSKRTALYAFYTRVSNGQFAALGFNGPVADKNSDLFQLGLRHRF
jgi:general bacterial porin, GBP family